MWRTVTGERSSSSGGRGNPQAATELSSLGLSCQDSPLLGLLSAVSRPAVSFLQRWSPLVPGRSLKQDLVEQQSEFLQQLDVLPPQQLHSLPWFNLSELGIQSPEGPQTQQTLQDPPGLQAQTLMGHVLLHPPGGVANTWLSGLWSGAEDERLKPVKAGLFTSSMDKTLPPRLPHLPHLPQLPPGLLHSLGLVGALYPDLDNGYSSLEEEQLQAAKAQLQTASSAATEEPAEEEEQEEAQVLKCENKAIAFIMGCPCSDDSGSDSDEDDDDDGFDSVCSSEISDSDDDEEEEEEEEEEQLDSEAERLWSALCQNHDPYNPRNFTAKLGSTPRPIPHSGPGPETSPSSVDSSSSCSSSASSSSSWDEASETEQETMKLLTAFCSSDPYSPLNFQASIRTKPGLETKPDPKVDPDPAPEEGRVRTSSESSHSSSRATRRKTKQVRFQAEVLVFSVGCEERRGPWEELARDRARFAKRCGDIEHLLSSCLQPEHRRRVYLRISQSEREEERREEAAGQSEREEGRREEAVGQSERE